MSEQRPYYNSTTFDAGYSVTYRPGIGVVLPNGRSLVDTIFNTDTRAKSPPAPKVSPLKLSSTTVSDHLSRLFHKLARNYFKVIVNQPFDVVRLLLQIGSFNLSRPAIEGVKKETKGKDGKDLVEDTSASYFFRDDYDIKNVIVADAFDEEEEEEEEAGEAEEALVQSNIASEKRIHPLSLHAIDVMSSVLTKEGTTSLWRATNVSYIYKALYSTIESWITGFCSSFWEIPDPFYIDLSYSPDPWKSLLLVVGAAVVTGLVLVPLDLVRTKLIVTAIPANAEQRKANEARNPNLKRSLRENVMMLRFWYCPIQLVLPTVLHSLSTRLVTTSTAYLIVTKMNGLPYVYDSSLRLAGDFLELVVKLPLETVLRRAQTSYLVRAEDNERLHDSIGLEVDEDDIVVAFRGYSGVFNTIFQGFAKAKGNDNSGWESMYRGWKVAVLNVLARWGFKLVSVDYYLEERF